MLYGHEPRWLLLIRRAAYESNDWDFVHVRDRDVCHYRVEDACGAHAASSPMDIGGSLAGGKDTRL
jgi:hypothetical protein